MANAGSWAVDPAGDARQGKEALRRAYVKKAPENGDDEDDEADFEDDLETDLGEAALMEDE